MEHPPLDFLNTRIPMVAIDLENNQANRNSDNNPFHRSLDHHSSN